MTTHDDEQQEDSKGRWWRMFNSLRQRGLYFAMTGLWLGLLRAPLNDAGSGDATAALPVHVKDAMERVAQRDLKAAQRVVGIAFRRGATGSPCDEKRVDDRYG